MLNFSFRTKKEEAIEKYPEIAVLTYIGGEVNKNFALNRKAVELLGYNSEQIHGKMVSFGPYEDTMFIANTTGTVGAKQSKVTLANEFANASFLARLEKMFKITLEAGQEFVLTESSVKEDFNYLIVSKFSPESYTRTNFQAFPDNFEISREKVIEEEEPDGEMEEAAKELAFAFQDSLN